MRTGSKRKSQRKTAGCVFLRPLTNSGVTFGELISSILNNINNFIFFILYIYYLFFYFFYFYFYFFFIFYFLFIVQ